MIHPYLRTRVGYVLCTTYVQPGIISYVPGMSRLRRYVYVDAYEPGLHPPKKEHNVQHTYQHVCTWYRPAPKIRICRYLCTRATSQKKNRTEGLLMKLLRKNKIKHNRNTELCHHRPRSKAHSNEYENNEDKEEQSLPAWRGAGRSSRGTKPLLSSSDGARSCGIRLPRDLWT